MYAQKKATQNVFNKKKLSFRSFEIKNKSEETLGELFTFFILETLMLSSLLNVNPINIWAKEQLLAGQLACLQGFRDTSGPRLRAGSVVTRMVPSQR